MNFTTYGNLRNIIEERNSTVLFYIAHDKIKTIIIIEWIMKFSVILRLKYNSASKSKLIIRNNMKSIHKGGWLTIVSKHMFMNVRKKNAVKSVNIRPDNNSLLIVELYLLRWLYA